MNRFRVYKLRGSDCEYAIMITDSDGKDTLYEVSDKKTLLGWAKSIFDYFFDEMLEKENDSCVKMFVEWYH